MIGLTIWLKRELFYNPQINELNQQVKYKNLFLSILVIAFGTAITIFLFYPGKSELGPSFGIEAILLMVRYLAWIGGVIFLLLRLLNILPRLNLFYSLMGTLNILIALFAFSLYFLYHSSISWFQLFFINQLVGALIFIDIYLLENIWYRIILY